MTPAQVPGVVSNLTVGNHHSALTRAARAEIRRDLRARTRTIQDVITAPPAPLRPMLIVEVLQMAPGFGRVRVSSICADAVRARINLGQPLGRASTRTRNWLLDRLEVPHRNTPADDHDVQEVDVHAYVENGCVVLKPLTHGLPPIRLTPDDARALAGHITYMTENP